MDNMTNKPTTKVEDIEWDEGTDPLEVTNVRIKYRIHYRAFGTQPLLEEHWINTTLSKTEILHRLNPQGPNVARLVGIALIQATLGLRRTFSTREFGVHLHIATNDSGASIPYRMANSAQFAPTFIPDETYPPFFGNRPVLTVIVDVSPELKEYTSTTEIEETIKFGARDITKIFEQEFKSDSWTTKGFRVARAKLEAGRTGTKKKAPFADGQASSAGHPSTRTAKKQRTRANQANNQPPVPAQPPMVIPMATHPTPACNHAAPCRAPANWTPCAMQVDSTPGTQPDHPVNLQ